MSDQELLSQITALSQQIARVLAEDSWSPTWDLKWEFSILVSHAKDRGLL